MKRPQHKTITCAVRLDKPLYDRLTKAAHQTHQTLSDVIRLGLLHQLESIEKDSLAKAIEMDKLKTELAKVQQLRTELESILESKERIA
tara:strand:- start:309 stop:575 length:267 start_codon:yes stop_codon:yes gene_type:complete